VHWTPAGKLVAMTQAAGKPPDLGALVRRAWLGVGPIDRMHSFIDGWAKQIQNGA